jgi:hypothetical protein
MADTQFKNVLVGAACIVSAMFVLQGLRAGSILDEKIKAQVAEMETVVRWRQSYRALIVPFQRWEKVFRKQDTIPDIVGLVAHVGLEKYGLQTDSDNVVISHVDPQIVYSGEKIGLAKICLATGSSSNGGFLVAAENYELLMQGIKHLAKRNDILIGNISLEENKAFPIAKLGDFCILLRN